MSKEEGGGSPILRRRRGKPEVDYAKASSPGCEKLVRNCENSWQSNPTSEEQLCSDIRGAKHKSPLCEITLANNVKKTSPCDPKIVREASLDKFSCTLAAANTLTETSLGEQYGVRPDTPHQRSQPTQII